MIITQSKNLPVAPSGASIRSAIVADAAVIEAEVNRLAGLAQTELNTSQNSAAALTASAQAAAAAQAAQAALLSALAPNEILPSVNKTFFTSANLVDVFIYDTKKDSDGGAWRKRCTQTSWYNEPLAGNYLGEAASEAAARALTSAVTGSYFHNTTDSLFYSLNATAGVTQIYRGGRADFPEQVIVTAEAGRVILWDATQAGMPMWMVFFRTIGVVNSLSYTNGENIKTIDFLNGALYIGMSRIDAVAPYYAGTSEINFVSDSIYAEYSAYAYSGNVSQRNSATSLPQVISRGWTVYGGVKDIQSISVTNQSDAPLNAATGLPIPTIAMGSLQGARVIRHDGTVVNIGTANSQYKVSLLGKALFSSGVNGTSFGVWKCADVTVATPVASDYYSTYGQVQFQMTDANSGNIHIRTQKGMATAKTAGLAVLVENPATPAAGMAFNVSNAFNSGWMVGDTRRCWLADSASAVVANPATEADRSVKNMPITVMGSIVKSAALGGRSLYTGFSATNFLQEASHADWNALGAGDFSILISGVKWGTLATLKTLLSLGSGAGAGSVEVQHLASNQLAVLIHNGTALAAIITTAAAFADTAEHTLEIKRGLLNGVASTLQILVDGVVVASAVSVLTISNATGFFRVGEAQAASRPWAGGQCANVRISATAPSADQSLYIATQENSIGANACILAGTSTSVTALAYDDAADLLHCATSWGRSTFSGLVRTASEATTLGAPKAMAAFEGTLVQAGATGAKVYVPAKYVRDELARAAEQAQKLGQPLVSRDYVATASQTAFVLPIGYTPKFVYQQGLLKRFATGAGNWSSSYDNFRWTVTLGTGAALGDVVSILTTGN